MCCEGTDNGFDFGFAVELCALLLVFVLQCFFNSLALAYGST